MATDCIAQLIFRFQQKSQPVVAAFDMAHASSDGGAVLLKAIDRRLGLTERLATCVTEWREPAKVQHSIRELLRQRVFGLALGYADCNDAARLAHDPIHKLLLDRDPLTGAALGSQPTLSRFENSVRRGDLFALAGALADTVIEDHRRRLQGQAARVTIDLDPTDDPTHGQQQFALFNGYYDTWCYLPLLATLTFNAEAQQYLVAAVLRPGTAAVTPSAIGLLRRLVAKLRAAFPTAVLRVRLDGGFTGEPLFAFLEAAGVEYVVGMANNTRLDKRVRRLQGRARMQAKATGESVQLFGGDALSDPQVVAQAAHRHEGRGAVLPRTPIQVQPALRRDQPARSAGDGLRGLRGPRRHGESHQGAETGAGAGPDQLLALPGQSVPGPADGRRLRALPRTATLRARAPRRYRAGEHPARAVPEGRRLGRALRPSHRAASADGVPLAAAVAATGPGPRRHALTPAARRRVWSPRGTGVSLARAVARLPQGAALPSQSARSACRPPVHLPTPQRASTRQPARCVPQCVYS